MTRETYTKTLENLEFETRNGKRTGFAVDRRTGRRLSPVETNLVKDYAKKEDPSGKVAAGKARKKTALSKAKSKSTGKTPGQRASSAIKKKTMPGRKK
jgi:glucose dehydrogenase